MRPAVLFFLVTGVFRCTLGHPGQAPTIEDASQLHLQHRGLLEEGYSLQEDGPQLLEDNNVEEEVTENEREVEADLGDEEAGGDGTDDDNGEGTEDQEEGEDLEVDNDVSSENDEADESKTAVSEKTGVTTSSPESKVLQTGNKKRRRKNSGPSKKMASKLLPLLMIPLMITMQLLPMMLLKLKLMALKALMLGKAAMVIILLNVLRNAFLGADSMEEQYEQQTLATQHYGYSGGPEYGAWINKRVYHVHPNGPYRGHQFVAAGGHQDTNSDSSLFDPDSRQVEENT